MMTMFNGDSVLMCSGKEVKEGGYFNAAVTFNRTIQKDEKSQRVQEGGKRNKNLSDAAKMVIKNK